MVSISIFHLFCVGLLLIPDQYQGPVVATVSGCRLRLMDSVAIVLIIAGSIVLNTYLFIYSRSKVKLIKGLVAQEHAKNAK